MENSGKTFNVTSKTRERKRTMSGNIKIMLTRAQKNILERIAYGYTRYDEQNVLKVRGKRLKAIIE